LGLKMVRGWLSLLARKGNPDIDGFERISDYV
jgi:hypothetical protein